MTPITEVEGRRLALSNLDKVLYPASGFTKGEVLHYYATAAGVLLPHLANRPVSFLRFPDGSEGPRFFTKNVLPGTPTWVRTAEVPRSGGVARQILVQDLATLMWAANLVTEFHTPQWQVDAPGVADRLVFDLDPGPPASVVEACEVALWLRDRLVADGFRVCVKTSGGKGLHLLVPLVPVSGADATAYAKGLAVEAERALPRLVVHRMARSVRPGKVFVDFSQNSAAKTTATAYTLRVGVEPAVSMPVTWGEVEACRARCDGSVLSFVAGDLGGRLRRYGDLLGVLLEGGGGRALPGG
ncbi:non-homologous end-joining DNA ligase [Streptomyces sp. NPDC059063]|uniref:non-homologous end-joining DNA ligase n=1 Tax=unclassified Streptomyces TaxID=2593676 RepID=UPI0036852898